MNGLKIQWVLRTKKNLRKVDFPILFSNTKYFAIGNCYNDDENMRGQTWEAQIYPSRYYKSYIEFGDDTDYKRNVFAIGY